MLEPESPAQALVRQFLAASQAGDALELRVQLIGAAQQLGLSRCIDDMLLPALRQIGQWWRAGGYDIELERLTTESARAWLETLSVRAPAPSAAPPLVLACGPGDRHTVGVEALATLLRYQRQSCRVLGSRTSINAIRTAVRANHCAGVIIVSHLSSAHLSAVQSLRALAELEAELFYAGEAFGSARSRRDVPGTYLGTNIGDACSLIMGVLTD